MAKNQNLVGMPYLGSEDYSISQQVYDAILSRWLVNSVDRGQGIDNTKYLPHVKSFKVFVSHNTVRQLLNMNLVTDFSDPIKGIALNLGSSSNPCAGVNDVRLIMHASLAETEIPANKLYYMYRPGAMNLDGAPLANNLTNTRLVATYKNYFKANDWMGLDKLGESTETRRISFQVHGVNICNALGIETNDRDGQPVGNPTFSLGVFQYKRRNSNDPLRYFVTIIGTCDTPNKFLAGPPCPPECYD